MAAPGLEGFARWVRFPTFQVTETADGYRVHIVDQRYARPGGFGTATVLLTEDLRPIGVEVN
jgi:inner membrane protein